ncbi:LysR family transcriptional regulator [Caldalkalibacillus salinus]|uniref:LysR family transcriptional regulator n=1 Tax=Caldalkalibacillus salinus TaxID=2803787 RepID=UPI001923A74B|nr:LysR family transcriptional regulator [Caldalkalibacillus salinus]
MDLLQLKYFQKVAQLKHITQAAQELHITQPALSQTIAKLEKDLGVPLFNREERRIQLNRYGEAFLAKVNIALNALEEGRREIDDMAGLNQGKIALDTTFIPHFPNVINQFTEQYPNVSFDISHAPSQEIKEALLVKGEIDFCITCHPIEYKGFQNVPIQKEKIVLAVPRTHPFAETSHIELGAASSEPFIGFRKGRQFRQMTDDLCLEAGFEANIVCETDEPQIINDLVASRLGIALLPQSLLDDNELTTHVHIKKPAAERIYYLSWKEGRYISRAAQTFRDFLIEHFTRLENESTHNKPGQNDGR